jgi:hypothetical protein
MLGHNRMDEELPLHRAALPKMPFHKFTGEHPHIWIDKCADYFRIFNIPECKWTIAASLHMEDNAAKWLHMHKLKHGLGSWTMFVVVVEEKFGVYDYCSALQGLL